MAVLVPIVDEEEVERLVLAYSKFQRILRMARKQICEGGGIRHEDFRQKAEIKSASVSAVQRG